MIVFRNLAKIRMPATQLYLGRARFSADNTNDSDDDFKPKRRVQLTDENAQQIIGKWVKENDIVLFMKGTPVSPMCGYSNYVVETLKKYGIIEFKSVNVLENSIIREQVKIFSKWPTYPQLYIKGELVGGSDIVQQMHKDGSFSQLLEEKGLL